MNIQVALSSVKPNWSETRWHSDILQSSLAQHRVLNALLVQYKDRDGYLFLPFPPSFFGISILGIYFFTF